MNTNLLALYKNTGVLYESQNLRCNKSFIVFKIFIFSPQNNVVILFGSSLATDWRPVQGVLCLRPTEAGLALAPQNPKEILQILKMDGLMDICEY